MHTVQQIPHSLRLSAVLLLIMLILLVVQPSSAVPLTVAPFKIVLNAQGNAQDWRA